MNLFEELLSKAGSKMVAIYKYNPADKSPLSLIKGLKFSCDALGYTMTDNAIRLFDEGDTSVEYFNIDTTLFITTDFDVKGKADKYGAFSARFSVANDDYLIKFA